MRRNLWSSDVMVSWSCERGTGSQWPAAVDSCSLAVTGGALSLLATNLRSRYHTFCILYTCALRLVLS